MEGAGEGWGPPGGAGHHQNFTRTRDCFLGGRAERSGSLALPSGPGQGRPAAPSPAMSSDPAFSGDTRPAGLVCPPPPSTDAREPLPHAAPDPRLHPGGPRPRRSACPGAEARRARRRRPEGVRALRRRRQHEFPTFSPGPGAAGADGTSRALPSPASWSHAPGWGLPGEAGRRSRGRGGARKAGGRTEEEAAGGGGRKSWR